MHLWTETKKESIGQSGRWQSAYHDSMIDHDKKVGEVLDKIDSLGIADNTIVFYSDGQWTSHEHLARWGYDAVPR